MPTNTNPEVLPSRGNVPEWVRVPEALKQTGLSRSYLYERISSGEIRSACIRQRGAVRGLRLIHYPSLLAFIEKFVGEEVE